MAYVDRNAPEALLAEITQAMRERVAPLCRHFGVCGGCQLQDLPYTSQTNAKEAMLIDLLRGAGIEDLPKIEVHTAEPWAYRNRARFRVEADAIGYSRRASNEFLAIEECPIASPLVSQTAFALRDLLRNGGAAWPVATSGFELFGNDDASAVQLSMQLNADVTTVDRDAPVVFRRLCERLAQDVPQLVGAGLSVAAAPDKTQSKRVRESQRVEIARWGEQALRYRVDGHAYRITRNAFFQVNRLLTERMVRLVLGNSGGDVAWDLFAGAGLFSVPLTERYTQVVAVEIGEPAATDLAAHLKTCGAQHKAVRSTTQSFLEAQVKQRASAPDRMVLDPPRAGLGHAVVRSIIALSPREIVYVSCDAGTFARDARPLIASGYRLAALHLLDLFPQTFHTETIAVFRR